MQNTENINFEAEMLSKVENFLRIDGSMTAANIMRARAVYFTAFIVFLTQIANSISMFFMLGGVYYVHFISLIAACVVLALGASVRWTKNFKFLTVGFVGVLLLGVVLSALPVGRLGPADGINSSMLPLLICGTVMCAMMYNWRAPLLFCIPAFGIIWGFYTLSTQYVRPDFVITQDIAMMQYVRAFQASLAMVLCGLITSYFSYRMFGLFDDLEANAKAARRAEGLTSRYLADISHELRTPLNGIIGFSNFLAGAPMAPKHKEYVEVIQDCGEGLLGIINDVLDLSKLDAGELTLEAEAFDLNRLCTNLVALHGASAAKKDIAVRLKYDDGVPFKYIGDEGRLRQILNNLLSNAVKFTSEGAVDLLVQGVRCDKRDYALKIYVRDTGVGIPAKDLPKVFARFQQLPSSGAEKQTTDKVIQKGTGLGLSITKELVEHMGGTVKLTSKVGTGTVFGILLHLPPAPMTIEPSVNRLHKSEAKAA